MKQKIRLTENDLHRIVKETVNKVLKESTEVPYLGSADFPGWQVLANQE